jgi:nodulation protein E
MDRAKARGAKIYAELAGFGMTSDALDMVQPSIDGAARAIRQALNVAELAPSDIDYVTAHGTGTPANDPTESKAIRAAFGPAADSVLVSSTKAMHGHGLGAAGSLELIATIGAICSGIVPPTINFTEADPECDLDYVPNTARERPISAAISNSFAFGGLNAVLAVKAV